MVTDGFAGYVIRTKHGYIESATQEKGIKIMVCTAKLEKARRFMEPEAAKEFRGVYDGTIKIVATDSKGKLYTNGTLVQ